MQIFPSCFSKWIFYDRRDLRKRPSRTLQKIYSKIASGAEIVHLAEARFKRAGFPRILLSLSLSGSQRLKAIRGSHAPAVRHLSLHVFPSSSFSTSGWCSLSLSPSFVRAFRYSPDQNSDPGYRVNRERDAHCEAINARDRSSKWFFWPRGTAIYYIRNHNARRKRERER